MVAYADIWPLNLTPHENGTSKPRKVSQIVSVTLLLTPNKFRALSYCLYLKQETTC